MMYALLAIALSLGACRRCSLLKKLPSVVLVYSFSTCWSFSNIYENLPSSGRYAQMLPVKRQQSNTNRFKPCRHGFTNALQSTISSSMPKPPAPTDWVIVEEYPIIAPEGIDLYSILSNNDSIDSNNDTKSQNDEDATRKYLDALQRLNVTQHNLTLPVALMVLDNDRFPSLSNARKACRQGKIGLCSSVTSEGSLTSKPTSFRKGLVGDRVYPLDRIARRELYKNLPTMNSSSSELSYDTLGENFVKSKFQNLKVAYEDDFMAVVVKPAGLLVHPQGKNGGWGRKNNVLNALPYFLRRPNDPARNSTSENGLDDNKALEKPVPVHRLDFATSGLMVAAKTRGSSRLLAQEFEYRKARKTYTAMVYGIPSSNSKLSLIPSFRGVETCDGGVPFNDEEKVPVEDLKPMKAYNKHLDDGGCNDDAYLEEFARYNWNLADCFLDEKRARTWWRLLGTYNYSVPVRYRNENSDEKDYTNHTVKVPISIVEMKPKTGRYHQLRRTMAWLYKTPIIGDPVYGKDYIQEKLIPKNAELVDQQRVKDYGDSLMLCSNKVDIAHPYFNTALGKLEWKEMNKLSQAASHEKNDSSSSFLYESEDGVVRLAAAIQLPKKFTKFIDMMERKKMNLISRSSS